MNKLQNLIWLMNHYECIAPIAESQNELVLPMRSGWKYHHWPPDVSHLTGERLLQTGLFSSLELLKSLLQPSLRISWQMSAKSSLCFAPASDVRAQADGNDAFTLFTTLRFKEPPLCIQPVTAAHYKRHPVAFVRLPEPRNQPHKPNWPSREWIKVEAVVLIRVTEELQPSAWGRTLNFSYWS